MGTSPFTRVAAGSVAGLLVVGAIGAAGCGGGSSSSTTTVASTTTSTTTSTSQGLNSKSVPPSTTIASTAYYNALVQALTTNGQMTSTQAQSAAHCIQDGLVKAGFKTQGDADGKNTKKALHVAFPCIQKARGQ